MLTAFGVLACAAAFTDWTTAPGGDIPDVPGNHWVYEALCELRHEGILIGYPEGIYRGPRRVSRYEAAVATHAASTQFHRIVELCRERNDAIARSEGSVLLAGIVATDISRRKAQSDFVRVQISGLAMYFARELKVLGVDFRTLVNRTGRDRYQLESLRLAKPGEALTLFPDVDRNHWAAAAIQNLRSQGILHGDGHSLFRG